MIANRPREKGWDVRRALTQMHGMEHAARLLVADLDRELLDRDSFRLSGPRSIGIATSATVQCAFFCEYSIKTFHALLSSGTYEPGHALVAPDGTGLYDHLEDRFIEVEHASRGDLSDLVIARVRSKEACCPAEWHSDIGDVRETLQIGATNFEDWRYGYAEVGELTGGIPKGLLAVAKGLELEARSRFNAADNLDLLPDSS